MKVTNLFFLALIQVYACFTFAYDDYQKDPLFKSIEEKTLYIYSKIPFMKGADLLEFKEAYSHGRRYLRKSYIQENISLRDYRTPGLEALYIIKEFDKMISELRHRSLKRMSLTLEGFFKSRINELYSKYRPKSRKLDFKNNLKEIDLAIYGVYSPSGVRPGQLNVTINITNLHTFIERSFSAKGSPKVAASNVAGILFDEFHRTRFPSLFDRRRAGKLELLAKELMVGHYYTPLEESYLEAKQHCEFLNGRLPSMRELTVLKRAGGYRGGIFIGNKEEDRFWGVGGDQIYSNHDKTVTRIKSVNGSKFFNYICVRSY